MHLQAALRECNHVADKRFILGAECKDVYDEALQVVKFTGRYRDRPEWIRAGLESSTVREYKRACRGVRLNVCKLQGDGYRGDGDGGNAMVCVKSRWGGRLNPALHETALVRGLGMDRAIDLSTSIFSGSICAVSRSGGDECGARTGAGWMRGRMCEV